MRVIRLRCPPRGPPLQHLPSALSAASFAASARPSVRRDHARRCKNRLAGVKTPRRNAAARNTARTAHFDDVLRVNVRGFRSCCSPAGGFHCRKRALARPLLPPARRRKVRQRPSDSRLVLQPIPPGPRANLGFRTKDDEQHTRNRRRSSHLRRRRGDSPPAASPRADVLRVPARYAARGRQQRTLRCAHDNAPHVLLACRRPTAAVLLATRGRRVRRRQAGWRGTRRPSRPRRPSRGCAKRRHAARTFASHRPPPRWLLLRSRLDVFVAFRARFTYADESRPTARGTPGLILP